ncbi:MAG: hypothetical protein ACK5RJ_04630 [Burkholderiales bacterium]|nr:hypothetical protein [Rhodocyclaceae bacterium]MCA3043076.1 hypothetical protein [Rhodocyclaceae bacterium]
MIKLIVVWMIVWLPVAGALASIMPISAVATATSDQSILAASASDSDVAGLPCHASDSSSPDADGKSCSHCVLCHIAGAIVPPTVPTMPLNTRHHSPKSIDSVSFTSFIAELPQRPPSLSRA